MIQILYATCIIGQQESASVMTAGLWPKKFAKICSQRELLRTASCKSYLSIMSNLILATLMRESEVLQLQTSLTLLCNLCLTGTNKLLGCCNTMCDICAILEQCATRSCKESLPDDSCGV